MLRDGVLQFFGGFAGADFVADVCGAGFSLDERFEFGFGLIDDRLRAHTVACAGGPVGEARGVHDVDCDDGHSRKFRGMDGVAEDGIRGGGEVDSGDDGLGLVNHGAEWVMAWGWGEWPRVSPNWLAWIGAGFTQSFRNPALNGGVAGGRRRTRCWEECAFRWKFRRLRVGGFPAGDGRCRWRGSR